MRERQQKRKCLGYLAVLFFLAQSWSFGDASITPNAGKTYSENSLQEVMEVPSEGTTRVCVTPLDSNTRLKVLHTNPDGGTEEVAVRRKKLTEDELHVLEIEVRDRGDGKPGLNVRLNGTEQQSQIEDTPREGPQQPHTGLLLKGNAIIELCPVAPGDRKERGREIQQGEREHTVTPGEEHTVTTSNAEVEAATSTSTHVSVTSFPTETSSNSTSEVTQPVEEDPWWSFMLVLGSVGDVPVLAMLIGGVLGGALLGGLVVCFCTKACKKRRVHYVPISRSQHSLRNDVIRTAEVSNHCFNENRSSGIGSLMSTLKSTPSPNNSMNRSIRSNHPSENNLGTTGSRGSTTGRNNNIDNNALNIPNNSSMTRYGSHRGTGHSSHRDPQSSLLGPLDSGRTRTSTKSSSGGSVNRNTNWSPNIPYTKRLEAITGHQDPSVVPRHNTVTVELSDSDDSNYDLPHVSSPIVPDKYSVPAEVIQMDLQTNRRPLSDKDKPTDRRVSPSHFATFKS